MTAPVPAPADAVRQLAASIEPFRRADAALARRRRVRKAAGVNDVTVLRLIYEAADVRTGCTPRDLAAQTGLRSASMSILLHRLERQGLIERRPNPLDARSVVISPMGERQNIGHGDDVISRIRALDEALTVDEAAVITRYLIAVADLLDAEL